jgi:hypothetical protein
MATEHHPHGDETPRGTMDITDHVKMWHSFWNVAKWSTLILILIAAFLAIFRTHNGY